MVQVISESPASIPPESQHARCKYDTVNSFTLLDESAQVKTRPNTLWNRVIAGQDKLHYTTEADVVLFVRIFLGDIANAMGIPFNMATDFGIKHVAPDICVLTLGGRLVGVVEIKKPQMNILQEATVLGELFDQMILVEGFYMSGPVIGILTTLVDWMFCWFPADTDHFCSDKLAASVSTSACLTPQKAASSAGKSPSPPRDTPSRTNRWSHGIELREDNYLEDAEFFLSESVERWLHTSPVINAYTDYALLLQYICSAFTRMTQVQFNHHGGVPRSVFKLHRGEYACPKISFHPLGNIPFGVDNIQSNKFPRASTKMLLALEDLGRGSTGKAWLCCTLSSLPALCVLKFGNRSDNASTRLLQEKKWWDVVYPEFQCMTKVDIWGGSNALMMPHICAIPERDRVDFLDSIRALLLTKFCQRGIRHDDVAWRNIG